MALYNSGEMTLQGVLTLVILIASLLALATQRLRPDLTALCATLALVLTGVLNPAEAFSAFGQPVIVIIASIYVLGAALYETGVATLIAGRLTRISGRGPALLIPIVVLAAGLLSGVLGSMLVVVVLMPAILRLARKTQLSPSLLLLPLAVGASMGNILTLIGTVSNLVVSDLLAASGHEPLGFFSLTPVGLASLLLAVLWFSVMGRRLLHRETPAQPERPSLDEVEHAYHLGEQLHRLRIRSTCDLVAQRLNETDLSTTFHLNVLAVQTPGREPRPPGADQVLEQDDLLIVEGSLGDILQAAGQHHLESKGAVPLEEFNQLGRESLRLAEVVVPFRSRLAGKTLAEIDFRDRHGLNILAVHRRDQTFREDLPNLTLSAGDTLLVQGPLAYLRQVGRDLNLALVTHLGPQPGDLITPKARLTLGILGAMIVCVASGLLPLATASLAAAVALVLTGCISLGRAYGSIEGRTIVLIGGMLPLALALEKTGAAKLIARQLTYSSPAIGPLGTLLLLYLFTCVLTQVVSNSAAAALMTPIAVNLATALGLGPRPFALAIAVAVTTSYLTPLTNTDNLLVRAAGRYTMRDYLVHGLPLFLLQTVALMVLLFVLYKV